VISSTNFTEIAHRRVDSEILAKRLDGLPLALVRAGRYIYPKRELTARNSFSYMIIPWIALWKWAPQPRDKKMEVSTILGLHLMNVSSGSVRQQQRAHFDNQNIGLSY
jgi:hypothetical protein